MTTYDRDQQQQVHSTGWVAQVWAAFGVSTIAAGFGIYLMPVDPWIRGYMAVTFLMAISSSISLSKTVRDIHEADRLVRKVDEAKMTKLLTERPVVT